MKEIKKMLLGIAIMLAVIVFHLFMDDGFLPDLIAVIGLVIVIAGYISKDGSDKPTE